MTDITPCGVSFTFQRIIIKLLTYINQSDIIKLP